MRILLTSLLLLAACGGNVLENDAVDSTLIGIYRVETALVNAGGCAKEIARPVAADAPARRRMEPEAGNACRYGPSQQDSNQPAAEDIDE